MAPCIRGHVDVRSVSNGVCLACGREASARSKRKPANAKRAQEYRAQRYSANRFDLRAKRREAYWADVEKSRAAGRASTKKWRAANPEIAAARESEWRAQNVGRVRAGKRRRRRAVQDRRPKWYGEWDDFVLEAAYELTALRQVATGGVWHVDHMVPLLARFASGFHSGENIQVIPERLNRAKGNKLWWTLPGEWIAST